MHSFLMAEYGHRVMFHTLCEHHAYNRCDGHCGVLGRVMLRYERKKGGVIGTAKAHAEFVNERDLKNTAKAEAIEVLREHDASMPGDLLKKKGDQVWGILGSTSIYAESPNIFDDNPNPTTSIVIPGKNVVRPHVGKDSVSILDIRAELRNERKTHFCDPCTMRFGHNVLNSEHDQSKHWFCSVTKVWRMENKNRFCPHCSKWVLSKGGHTQGKHLPCPSKDVLHKVTMFHKTIPLQTLLGLQNIPLKFHKDPELNAFDLNMLKDQYAPSASKPLRTDFRRTTQSWMLVEGILAIFKHGDKGLSKKIPWLLGECLSTDLSNKTYTMILFKPDKANVPIWNMTFTETDTKFIIPFNVPLELPIRLTKSGRIPPYRLYNVENNSAFNWHPMTYPDPATNTSLF
jgi:hypothetical protein